ncbi:MAG: hypothetical protein ACTSXQ_03310 [Alphaproteobacteria bacterium]
MCENIIDQNYQFLDVSKDLSITNETFLIHGGVYHFDMNLYINSCDDDQDIGDILPVPIFILQGDLEMEAGAEPEVYTLKDASKNAIFVIKLPVDEAFKTPIRTRRETLDASEENTLVPHNYYRDDELVPLTYDVLEEIMENTSFPPCNPVLDQKDIQQYKQQFERD